MKNMLNYEEIIRSFCIDGQHRDMFLLRVYAQKRLVLDLNQTIALANDSSLESFRTQNMYLSGYWEYRTTGKPFAESDNGPYPGTI